jgi:hypothetical protein
MEAFRECQRDWHGEEPGGLRLYGHLARRRKRGNLFLSVATSEAREAESSEATRWTVRSTDDQPRQPLNFIGLGHRAVAGTAAIVTPETLYIGDFTVSLTSNVGFRSLYL